MTACEASAAVVAIRINRAWRSYMEHARECGECGDTRCAPGEALYRAYRAVLVASR